MQSVKEKLRTLMDTNDMRAYTLARKANVPESSIKNILNGKSKKPRFDLLYALSQQLDCDVTDLLADNDARKSSFAEIAQTTQQGESKSADSTWDGVLYLDCTKAVLDLCDAKEIKLSTTMALECIIETYNYSKHGGGKAADERFAQYIVDRMHDLL